MIDRELFVRCLSGQNRVEQTVLLASLMSYLTIVARNYYAEGVAPPHIDKICALNEIENKISTQLVSLVSERTMPLAFPVAALVDVILEWAVRGGLNDELDWAFRQAKRDVTGS